MNNIQKLKQRVGDTIRFTYTCQWIGCEESLKYGYDGVNDCPKMLPKRWQYVYVSRGGRINEDTGLPPASDVYGVVCSKHAMQIRSLLKKKNNNNIIKLPDEKRD